MKVGIIAPIRLLEEYCLTNIQYCLPKLILENREYREFYQEKVEEGKIVILDARKVGWKREPEEFYVVEQSLKLVRPSFLVYPSYMYDWNKTVKVAKEFRKRFNVKGVGCLEGTTVKEVNKCMRGITGVFTYAIPSHLYSVCKKVNWDKPLVYIDNHLCLEELSELNGILLTSLPVRLGLEGRLLSDYVPSPPSLTFHEEDDRYPIIVAKNVEEAIEYYEE